MSENENIEKQYKEFLEKLEQQAFDNDIIERLVKQFFNFIIMLIIIIVLAVILFKGDPDLVDNVSSYINGGQKCL